MIINENIKWKEFFLCGENGIFKLESSKSGIDKNKLIHEDSEDRYPYITRSNIANGVSSFITDQNSDFNHGNVITVGLDTQTVFYQPSAFYTGQNILILSNENLTKEVAMFMIPLIKSQINKFSWGGTGATIKRLTRTKVLLPISNNGKPDYKLMSQCIKQKIKSKRNKYFNYLERRLKNIDTIGIENIVNKNKKAFYLSEIFEIKSGVRLTKADMLDGTYPFIGATDSNNGITGFVSNENRSLDHNLLGVNYNGSVCYSFYHSYECIFSDDVKRFKLKNGKGNEFIYLFLSTVISQQRVKFSYGYKFKEGRMKKQKIMLPVNDNNEPDYEYMEQYIKNIICDKYRTYISKR